MPKRFSFKGWYKGWFFRSLKELSHVMHMETIGQSWETAEVPELSVEYTNVYGKTCKHYADFFVDKQFIIEIKPKAHQRSKTVKLKADAMRAFCDKKGYIYMMISPRKIDKKKLEELIEKNLVTFTDDCKHKIHGYLKRRR